MRAKRAEDLLLCHCGYYEAAGKQVLRCDSLRSLQRQDDLAFGRRIEDRFLMCRNIKVLANFEPPATTDEVRASALQFVRKLSGTTKPSRANEAAFNQAVEEVAIAAQRLLNSLQINAPPRNREEEARKAKERSKLRFG